ncbi:MAG: FAD-dependent oxidoreductase [Clostridia bacterium]
MENKMLFSPLNIGKITIKNRLVMSPMLMDFGQFDGKATDELIAYYEERAKGGTGLIITEITRVNDVSGASSFAQLGMSHDYQIESMAKLAKSVQKHGAKLFVQLHHPGRQNLGLLVGTVPLSIMCDKVIPFYESLLYKIVPTGKKLMEHDLVPRVVSPSACDRAYFSEGKNRGLSIKGIKAIQKQFIQAAVRVQKAGADGVELHAAHGYLLQQFLSPVTNQRDDEYGGKLENRMRFLLEIISGIRTYCGKDFPIIVRLSVDECYNKIGQIGKGYTLDEGVKMAKILEKAGIDAIDVSSAGYDTFNYWLEPTTFKCGWRAYMAKAVKEAVNIPVLAANLIRSAEQAESQLQDGTQDFVSLGRPHIADPHWAKKVEENREEDVKRCICCLRCFESMQHNAYIGDHGYCAVNPFVGKEEYKLEQNGNGRTVVVVGSGVAGLTCAELLLKRGFKVVVLEKDDTIGGQIKLATAPPNKEKLNWCVEDLHTSCQKLGVDLRTRFAATASNVLEFNPYAIIIATGVHPLRPKSIKGIDKDFVYSVDDVLSGKVSLENKKVVVVGSGMTGLETCEYLCEKGNSLSVLEMSKDIAPGTWMQHIDDILPKLKKFGTEFYLGEKLVEITDSGLKIQNVDTDKTSEISADAVVLSLGVRSNTSIYDEVRKNHSMVFLAGDAHKPGRIADATRDAFELVCTIN